MKELPKTVRKLLACVRQCWEWKGKEHCRYRSRCYKKGKKCWHVTLAPRIQEVVGGSQDGEPLWSPFAFDVKEFFMLDEIGGNIEISTLSAACDGSPPLLRIVGKVCGKKFKLSIVLVPMQRKHTHHQESREK